MALAGQHGYPPSALITAANVLINGFRLPYVNSTTKIARTKPLSSFGDLITNYPITNSPVVNYPPLKLDRIAGELRAPIIDDPLPGTIDGQARLSAADVSNVLAVAAVNAAKTRAGIRLPVGTLMKVFIAVVNNPGPTNPPLVLGTFRINDATVFSWDVAVQKARTAFYFSRNGTAFSSRAVGFLAETLYPPGINDTSPGPFLGLQEIFSLLQGNLVTNPLNGFSITTNGTLIGAPLTSTAGISLPLTKPFPSLPDGITIFPGGFPLYRNGVMIGAVGVSGDGVDQDDLWQPGERLRFSPRPRSGGPSHLSRDATALREVSAGSVSLNSPRPAVSAFLRGE